MFGITVRLEPDAELAAFIHETLNGQRRTEMHKAIAEDLPGMMREHFQRQQNPDGSSWPPLTELSASLRYTGSLSEPGIESGGMYDSLLAEPTDTGAVGGSPLERAMFFNAGGDIRAQMLIPLSAPLGPRLAETPHLANRETTDVLELEEVHIPERRFAWVDDEQARRLMDRAVSILLA